METLVETCEQGGSTSHDNRIEEGLSNIDVTPLDGVNDHLVDTRPLETNLIRTEQDLWGLELL